MSETRRRMTEDQDAEDLEEDRRRALLEAAAGSNRGAWTQTRQDLRDALREDEED